MKNRNSCINNFNSFYTEAKNQDKFYIKQDLIGNTSSIISDLEFYRPYDEVRIDYPWITPDVYIILFTLLQIKKTSFISNVINDYNINHDFDASSWMGICEHETTNYAYDKISWRRIHSIFVMNYSRAERVTNATYFKKFCKGSLKVDVSIIRRNIKNGSLRHFDRIDIPNETDGKTVHGQQIHIHLKNDGALNIDGTEKHKIGKLSTGAATDLVKIGFILPENL